VGDRYFRQQRTYITDLFRGTRGRGLSEVIEVKLDNIIG